LAPLPAALPPVPPFADVPPFPAPAAGTPAAPPLDAAPSGFESVPHASTRSAALTRNASFRRVAATEHTKPPFYRSRWLEGPRGGKLRVTVAFRRLARSQGALVRRPRAWATALAIGAASTLSGCSSGGDEHTVTPIFLADSDHDSTQRPPRGVQHDRRRAVVRSALLLLRHTRRFREPRLQRRTLTGLVLLPRAPNR
jgi:hypothetical protein